MVARQEAAVTPLAPLAAFFFVRTRLAPTQELRPAYRFGTTRNQAGLP